MELEEAKNTLLEIRKELAWVEDVEAIDTVISELFAMQNLLDEKNEELDRLQKEIAGKDCLIETLDHNEEVKDEYIKHLEEKTRNSITKDKIREKIEEIKTRMNDDCLALHEFQRIAKIDVLQNLLKEE